MPSSNSAAKPNAHMRMSLEAKARMRSTERAVYKYYNDMGKNKGHCTWGAGILAHRGVCSEEELGRKVSVTSAGAASNISAMTRVRVKGKLVVAPGLIKRRAEESAPFRVPVQAASTSIK